MTLKELSKVMGSTVRSWTEVRQETDKLDTGYRILGQGNEVFRKYGHMNVSCINPVVFNGEFHPSTIVWVEKESA